MTSFTNVISPRLRNSGINNRSSYSHDDYRAWLSVDNRITSLTRYLIDHVPFMCRQWPTVLIRLIAEYARHQIMIVFNGDSRLSSYHHSHAIWIIVPPLSLLHDCRDTKGIGSGSISSAHSDSIAPTTMVNNTNNG
jgi:hypothetical protein